MTEGIGILGATGAGKSKLANVLIGDFKFATFAVGNTLYAGTTDTKRVKNVIDTQGFDDPQNDLVFEAKIYDNIIRKFLSVNKIRCLIYVQEYVDRLKSSEQENLQIYAKFPDTINKIFVVSKMDLTKDRTSHESRLNQILREKGFESLALLPKYMIDCDLYADPEADYHILKNLQNYKNRHLENEKAFTDLIQKIKDFTPINCKTELLKLSKENPFKNEMEEKIQTKMSGIISSTITNLVSDLEKLKKESLESKGDDDFASQLEILKIETLDKIKISFQNQVDPKWLDFLQIESLSSYNNAKEDITNNLNEAIVNFTKLRQIKVIKKKTIDVIEKIHRKAVETYQQTNNPFATIEVLHSLWEQEKSNLAQSTEMSTEEAIEIYETTKNYVESELNSFRKLIFGNSYRTAIKAKVLDWSADARHLANDSYKDLHQIICVKCPGCSYPWANQGACPSRTCLFCLTQFKWNEATVVMRQDWDSYNYDPVYVPRVGESPKYKTEGTVIGSFK